MLHKDVHIEASKENSNLESINHFIPIKFKYKLLPFYICEITIHSWNGSLVFTFLMVKVLSSQT